MEDYELQICIDESELYLEPGELVCRLPVANEREAADMLEIIGTGGALGTGYRWQQMGVELPRIRTDYERAVGELVEEVARRRGNVRLEELARWAAGERLRIARSMRVRQGISSVVLLEARDNVVYGLGGRTFPNLERRYRRRGFEGARVYEKIVEGATHPNTDVSRAAIRGARYLKYGGRVVLVTSVATTAHAILTAPEQDLPRVLSEEGGALAGGAVGAELAIGLCLVFGIATGGWGLLACGVLGGVGGGVVGAEVGNRLYYTASEELELQAQETAVIDAELLSETMPNACW